MSDVKEAHRADVTAALEHVDAAIAKLRASEVADAMLDPEVRASRLSTVHSAISALEAARPAVARLTALSEDWD